MQSIQTKYLGPTNYRGSRIKAYSGEAVGTNTHPSECKVR